MDVGEGLRLLEKEGLGLAEAHGVKGFSLSETQQAGSLVISKGLEEAKKSQTGPNRA